VKGRAVTGIFWGLLSALSYGSADYMARGVSARLTPYHGLFYIHMISGLLLFIVVLLDGIPATVNASALGLAILLGALNTLATLLLYRSLLIGKVSIVSPITSTFGGVTLLLSLLAGDYISPGGIFSLVLMLVGILIVSVVREAVPEGEQRAALRGLPEAVGAALAIGLNFWALQFVIEPLGPYIPTLVGRVVTVILLPLLAKPLHQSVAVPPRSLWLRIGVVALVTTIGEVAYNVGVQGTTPGVVAVISSLFSPVTVVLAMIFLHERLARHQWVGVGIIFVATVLVGVSQNFSPA
jgi:drug/metabolite transporter (DMT)-like permease